jgi:translation initiation factor 2 subunit 3
LSNLKLPRQPEINIGTAGHVDHGKTTLIQSLTGIWASSHSEELRRGITIKVGYADAAIFKCKGCPPPRCFTTDPRCPECGTEAEFLRAVSFVDCPGHEILMTTMLSGAAVMDGAILVISANETCPMPQTREHLAALEITGIKRMIIAQNKIDVVSRERAVKSYQEITKFIKGTIAEDAPIIPISSQNKVNIDLLIENIERVVPTPKRDPHKPPYMYIVRSFDVNRPGTLIENMSGGIIGGSIAQGTFEVGDTIELSPGNRIEKAGKTIYEALETKVTSLYAGGESGLIGIGTTLDPALTKADGLVGNVAGAPGSLPPVFEQIALETHLFEEAIGTSGLTKVDRIRLGETLVLNVGTAVTVAIVNESRGDHIRVALKRPICTQTGSRVALSRKIADRWRLIGYGLLQ